MGDTPDCHLVPWFHKFLYNIIRLVAAFLLWRREMSWKVLSTLLSLIILLTILVTAKGQTSQLQVRLEAQALNSSDSKFRHKNKSPLNEFSYSAISATNDFEPPTDKNNSISLSASGLWAVTYGGELSDSFRDAIATMDGGILAVGSTASFNVASYDSWIVKLNRDGSIAWQKSLGGGGSDFLRAVRQTSNGEYILVGSSDSFGSTSIDAWIVKLKQDGSIAWQKTFASSKLDSFRSVQATNDGGYIVAGELWSSGLGTHAALVIKFDEKDDILWQRVYDVGTAHAVHQTLDGKFVVAGSNWVMKLSDNGDYTWAKTYSSGGYRNSIYSIYPASDGGVVTAGTRRASSGAKPDAWIMKLNSDGVVDWSRTYGGQNYEEVPSVLEREDRSIVFAGVTSSFGAGALDVWIVKLDPDGDILWEKTYGGSGYEHAWEVHEMSDGKLIVAADKTLTGGNQDSWALKLESDGEISDCSQMGQSTADVTDLSISVSNMMPSSLDAALTPINSSATTQNTTAESEYVCSSDVCADRNDVDGDGIPNGWELCGYDFNGDGDFDDDTDVRLPEMGADPNGRDIFVEIDYMVQYDEDGEIAHSHQPLPETIDRVVRAFEQQGIHLHVDWGSQADLKWGDAPTWGSLADGEILEHRTEIQSTGQWNWAEFDFIKNDQGHFKPERREIFHYSIFAHGLGGGIPSGVSGISRHTGDMCTDIQFGGSDFVVSLGEWRVDGTGVQQAGTFMHELGHNLGLCHGGDDNLSYKPNYLSVMNYSFQTDGLIIDEEDGHIDYSSFGNNIIPPLVETDLNESVGLNGGTPIENYGTRYYCRPLGLWLSRRDNNANSGIDWNCNGIAIGAVEANINDGDRDNQDNTLSTLFAYDDWNNLVFDGDLIGSTISSSELPASPPLANEESSDLMEELTFNMAETFCRPYATAIGPSSIKITSPGLETSMPITLTNTGALTATVILSHTTASWFDLSTIPVSVTLVPSSGMRISVDLIVPDSTSAGDSQEIIVNAVPLESPMMGDSVRLSAQVGPKAWFEAAPVVGRVPLTVEFTDISVGEIDSWLWEFGDGATSNEQNPSHTYTALGVYTISLTATGPAGSNTYTRKALVRAEPLRVFLPLISK